jgi:hypothetical protein
MEARSSELLGLVSAFSWPGQRAAFSLGRHAGTVQRPLSFDVLESWTHFDCDLRRCDRNAGINSSKRGNLNNLNFVEASTAISTKHTTTTTMGGPRATVERLDQPSAYFNSRVSFRCDSNRRSYTRR